MAAAREIDSDRLGPAPDQLALVGIAEHPVLGENRERWNLQSFPLVPARFMHSLDRALHDRGVETRDEPIIRRLEIRYPGINDRVITINELTVRQILEVKNSFSGSGNTLEAMQQLLPLITDVTPDFLLDLAPSELSALYEKAKEVNSAFLAILPLDKLLAGYQGILVENIQKNLMQLSVNSLPRATA